MTWFKWESQQLRHMTIEKSQSKIETESIFPQNLVLSHPPSPHTLHNIFETKISNWEWLSERDLHPSNAKSL